ncbi:zinc-ribbon domain-containing protein [Chryseobacterium indoltheticum]|uniref:zinc-ribbon domain-containing protein n=1 Tax=Chryseobacterium indoltheticum TaxID=254 RepID=UPI003F491415
MNTLHAECKNCHHSLNEEDRFCSKCGQNTDTHKINLHYVIHELIHGILQP